MHSITHTLRINKWKYRKQQQKKKEKNRIVVANYRSINLLSNINKIFEKIINGTIRLYTKKMKY